MSVHLSHTLGHNVRGSSVDIGMLLYPLRLYTQGGDSCTVYVHKGCLGFLKRENDKNETSIMSNMIIGERVVLKKYC